MHLFFLSVGGHRWLNKWRKTFSGQLQENIAGSLPVMASFLLAGKLHVCSADTAPLWKPQSTSIPPPIMNLIPSLYIYFLLRLFKMARCFSHSATVLSNNLCLPFGVVRDKLSSNLCDFGAVSPEIHRTEPLSHKQAGVIIDFLHGGALIKITFLVTVQASRRLEMKIPGAGARLFPHNGSQMKNPPNTASSIFGVNSLSDQTMATACRNGAGGGGDNNNPQLERQPAP